MQDMMVDQQYDLLQSYPYHLIHFVVLSLFCVAESGWEYRSRYHGCRGEVSDIVQANVM